MTNDELRARLEDIGNKIERTKSELRLRGIFNKEHQITQDELDARYRLLTNQLDNQVSSLAHHHVSALEREVLNWVNAIDFDSR